MSAVRRSLSVLCAALLAAGLAVPAQAAESGPLTWHQPKVVDALRGGLTSVSCVSTSFCLAGDGNGKVLRYDGSGWHPQAMLSTYSSAVAPLTCLSRSFCAGGLDSREGGAQPMVYRDGSWHLGTFVEVNGISGSSCVSTSFCVNANDNGTYQVYNGTRWTAPRRFMHNPDFQVAGLSCVSRTYCLIADGPNVYRYNGSAWSTPRTVDAGHDLAAISCPTRAWCMAVDRSGRSIVYSSGAWHRPKQFGASADHPAGVDCARAAHCVAVDGLGRASTYTDGTWSRATRIGSGSFFHVSCATVSSCVAVSASGEAAIRTFGHWHATTHPDPALGGLAAVSCASATRCVGVDYSGGWLRFDGSRWTTARRISYRGDESLQSISCPTSTFCMAVGNYARRLDGNTWSAREGTHIRPYQVACASPKLCIAVGFSRRASVYNGKTWTVETPSSDELSGVSCTRTFCEVSSAQGSVLTYRAGHWSAPHKLLGSTVTVSCAPGPFCLAYGSRGVAFGRIDGTWRPVARIFGGRYGVGPVACTSRSFCVATGGQGRASTYNGTSWSAPVRVMPRPGAVTTLSCVERKLCVAVDPNHDSVIVAT